MTPKEEKDYWCGIVNELHNKFTLEYLACEFDVTVRTISNWKSGDCRPMGMKAVKVYLFHAKHRSTLPVEGNVLHVQVTGKLAM